MSEENRKVYPKRRKLLDLILKMEGLKQDRTRPATQSELARAWKVGRMVISNYCNAMRLIPEWRLVWIMKRYKGVGLTWDEIGKALEADFPHAEITERHEDMRVDTE